MGLFTSSYKEDAMKWRSHTRKSDELEIARVFQMTIEITLKDGSIQYSTYTRKGRHKDVGFLDADFVVENGYVRLESAYEDIKKQAGTIGLESDSGCFIPHSNISHIRNIGISEVSA